MTNDPNKNWSDALLQAHFKSLNQAWSDRNSVMLLLSEIREFLGSDKLQRDPKAKDLKARIEIFASTAATRIDRQPMKTAGKRDDSRPSGKKAG